MQGELSVLGVVAAAVVALLSLVGVVGNVAVIYLVASRSHLCSVTNVYIMNRAIADLLQQLFAPLVVYTLSTGNFVFGPAMCKIYSMTLQAGVLMSCVFLSLFSIDCYLSSRPQHHALSYRWKMLKAATAVTWVSGGIVAITAYFYTYYYAYRGAYICLEGPLFSGFVIDLAVSNFVVFVIPLIIVWVFVSLSFPSKDKSVATPAAGPTEETTSQTKTLLVWLTIVFTACLLLCWISRWIEAFGYIDESIHDVIIILSDLNIAANVILYFRYNKDFRQELPKTITARSDRMEVTDNL